jgi:succinate dehydrogenase/fumarate reductase flavoprotein subunit
VAEALGLPVEATMETIRRYNALCRTGKDEDFHKKPKYLQEIREAPFYGCSLSDRLFFTVLGGPRTNYKMQICNAGDEPIPGLWCVGSMVGDMYANCYNFRIPGQNYGACLTFGYLTGKRVAEE